MRITERSIRRLLPMPIQSILEIEGRSRGSRRLRSDSEGSGRQVPGPGYRAAVRRSGLKAKLHKEPASLPLAIKTGVPLILGATVETSDVALTFDGLERQLDRGDDKRSIYVPVQFSHRNKLTRHDSLLAAFHGIILADALEQPVPFVKVVHGSGFSRPRSN